MQATTQALDINSPTICQLTLLDGWSWKMANLQQTPSHVGIFNNLKADALAKLGANQLQQEFTVTLISATK